jgi:hypothetical protein
MTVSLVERQIIWGQLVDWQTNEMYLCVCIYMCLCVCDLAASHHMDPDDRARVGLPYAHF